VNYGAALCYVARDDAAGGGGEKGGGGGVLPAVTGRGTALRRAPTQQQLQQLGNDELRVLAGADVELRLYSTCRHGAVMA
jgi:hypothetical protein